MICTKVLGNVHVTDVMKSLNESYNYEKVTLTWDECGKRILRKRTDQGREIGISLPLGTSLRHGDILFREDSDIVVAYVLPCEVFVVYPDNIREVAIVAYELGNRHLPLEITENGEILLLPDKPTETLLGKLAVHVKKELRQFTPLSKGGGHDHS